MLSDKVKSAVKKFSMIERGEKVLVGVSGGPDSLALLYVLNGLSKELGFKLHVAHLDHMLRTDSAKDRAFVEKTCRNLRIPVTAASINIKALSKKGSVEEIARNARLGFLFKVAEKENAGKIALGHNLDDQAETVLMRLLRGTGLYGLSGIMARKEMFGHTLIRPLIETRRKEIETFLKRKKLKARVDISNSQDIYFRNKIRNRLLPLLEKDYNPNIKQVLSNTAECIAADYDLLSRISRKAMERSVRTIALKRFLRLHVSARRMILRFKIAGLKGDSRRISFKHIQEIEVMLNSRPVGSVVDLPGNIRVKKTASSLAFSRQ